MIVNGSVFFKNKTMYYCVHIANKNAIEKHMHRKFYLKYLFTFWLLIVTWFSWETECFGEYVNIYNLLLHHIVINISLSKVK